jgi:hypothetical protein
MGKARTPQLKPGASQTRPKAFPIFSSLSLVTTDGWKAVQNAWKGLVPEINLLECRWHGRKRINGTLKEYAQQHPELTTEEFQLLKQQFGHLFAAPSLAAYSQRLRRLSETYGDDMRENWIKWTALITQ